MKVKSLSYLLVPTALLVGCGPKQAENTSNQTKNDEEKKTNYIFIMADDLGYSDLGCYGQKEIKTPNIDKLAQEGLKFTQCYSGSTVSAPSRSVLMTGQHTGNTTVRGNMSNSAKELTGSKRVPLKPEDVTVAEIFKQADYATGITGKWGLGEPNTSGIPTKQGFDQWLGYLNQKRAHDYYPDYIWQNEDTLKLEKNKDGKGEQYTHDYFTDFSLNFIKNHKEEAFFLYIPYTIPHDEYEIPEINPLYADKDWTDEEKIYASMITLMDTDVGQIMQLLKELNIDENTMVFFTSDNGTAKRWDGRFNSSGDLKGYKRDMYEGGIRVPMILRQPNVVPAGKTDETPWYFADVLPTMAAMINVEAPKNIDGVDISPLFFGKTVDVADRWMYWEFHEKGFQQAARWKNWKALKKSIESPIELYDLSNDLGEENNVADKNPEIVQKFENYLKNDARSESEYWPIEQK